MKTKSLLRYAHSFATFIMVFLWTAFSLNAQCPTVTDPTPPPICDASGYTFANLSSDFAIDNNGNGIVWYDNAAAGNTYDANELVQEGITYYADDDFGTCTGGRNSITVTFQVSISISNTNRIYCSNENPTVQTYIDDVFQTSIPVGGSVEVYNDINLTDQASLTDAIPAGAKNYFIVFYDGLSGTGCSSQIIIGPTALFVAPSDPTPNPSQEFCSDTNPTIANLDPGTTDSFSWYQNINGSGDPIPPALLPSKALVSGATYYVQVDGAFCDSNAVPVNITIDDPVDAGNSEDLVYCSDDVTTELPFNLFDELGGTPNTTGSWTGPLTTSNGHLGTVDISSLTTEGTYVFTYTVLSNNACPDNTSTVSIMVYETLSSGTALSPASFCEATLPASFDLYTLIESYDAGGQWTEGTTSGGTVVADPMNLILTGYTPATYNFTYTQNLLPNPCPEQSTTVQVIVLPDPNAGIADNPEFCENDLASNSPFNLFDALTAPYDSGGTWTDASNTPVSNSIDITGFTVVGSSYNFTYTVDNGTCTDDETISITILEAPESGTPVGAFPEFCEGEAPVSFDLYSLIEGENGTGTWTNNTTSTIVPDPNSLDLSGYTDGTYDFTFDIDPIASCDDVDVVVSVIINPLPNTGTADNPAPFCENDPALSNTSFDLFTLLTGTFDAGGTWSDDSTTPITGALSGNTLDLSQLVVDTYNFTYTITDANTCTNSTTVTISIVEAPESGTVNTPIEFCVGTAPTSYDLFELLTGEDQTGTWSDDDASGALSGNLVDLSGLIPATYNFTFDVDAVGSCDDELVTVSVIINPLPNTGTADNPAPFCINDPALSNTSFDLFTLLTGTVDAGGTWSDDSTTPIAGALSGNTLDLSQLVIDTYNFTYTITDANMCTNSTTVTISIVDAPESGTAMTPVQFCLSEITAGQTYNLFDLLSADADQTGTWSDDDASLALTGNTVALDALAQGNFNFTFDVDAIGSCDDVNVTVSIIINDTAAPLANTPQEFCDSATVADLVATGNSIQWYDVLTGGTALAGTTALGNQTYYAIQTDATTGCESSVRTAVTVTIYTSPNAGNPNTTPIVICNNTTTDLNAGLDGTQDTGGTWNNDDGVGALVGNIFDATGVSAGTYNFTYTVTASAPCIDDSTPITITVQEPLTAGTSNGDVDLCSVDADFDLFSNLTGEDAGGEWSYNGSVITNPIQPSTAGSGTYTYTLTNSCGVASVSFEVNIVQAANAGTNGDFAICTTDIDTTNNILDLLTVLNGTPDNTGEFTTTDLSGFSGTTVDLSTLTSGTTYNFTYTVTATSPCTTDSTADITVIINDSPTIIVDNANPEFCLVNNPTIADLADSISATGTVNWYEDAALTLSLTDADALVDGEDYYATQTNNTGCESSTAVQINATINDTATPVLDDPSMEYCINDGPTISDLASNINYDSTLYSIVWYDAATGGSVISSSTNLTNTTYYAVLVDPVTGCESSERLVLTPDVTACGKLEIPDGFSPNGDGVNDTFDVDNLAILYPNFEMEIYNRYGSIVYKGNANSLRFDGTSNQSKVISKGDLPVGVYFYIFKFNDGENKPEQGRLYLSR
ncbi:gliding motility-associated C-terminal domain-containing protein [Flaviramulus basaltis]|nr:gliding motility-associated C-terminal domain-containing protein [Flaviramulus basaltis]